MGDASVAEAVHEVETGPYSYGHPSSFEAVAGLLWVAITRARDLPPDSYTRFALPVNMRRRWCPPLPPLFFGNASLPAMAVARSGDLLERHFSYAARLVHESIFALDSEYGQAAVDWLETQLQQHGKVSLGGLMMNDGGLHASVMTGYSLYELDFGWERPIHVSLCIHLSIPFGTVDLSGSIVVISTPSGAHAREFLIFLKMKHMNKLIRDPFISHYLEGEEQVVHQKICPPKSKA
ncbi:hypothetical protein O6H91_24G004200 [Diphasiastrum complanatum]|uniref:Uncharacterized protein n=1 Tax=Diphasiastrum complanatum TaxID=34168 RepID=A0ACC2A8T4_DIPCM|nr:hypothetical protein O6H91_24G004200 [Diphasiastrum complanatum]